MYVQILPHCQYKGEELSEMTGIIKEDVNIYRVRSIYMLGNQAVCPHILMNCQDGVYFREKGGWEYGNTASSSHHHHHHHGDSDH